MGHRLLAGYVVNNTDGQSLADYLDTKVFAGNTGTTVEPDPADVAGFNTWIETYKKGLAIEQAAVCHK